MEQSSKVGSEDTRTPGTPAVISNTNLLVKSIRADATLEQFRAAFTKFGNITSAVLKDREVKLAGDQMTLAKFGFVNFDTKDEADNAYTNAPNDPDVNELIDKRIIGSEVFIFFHQRKTERNQEMMMKKMFPGEEFTEESFEKFLLAFQSFLEQNFGDAVNNPGFMDSMTESIRNGNFPGFPFGMEATMGEQNSQNQPSTRASSNFEHRSQSGHGNSGHQHPRSNVPSQNQNSNFRGNKPNSHTETAHQARNHNKHVAGHGMGQQSHHMGHPGQMSHASNRYGNGYSNHMGRGMDHQMPGSHMQHAPGGPHAPPPYMMGSAADHRHPYGPPSHPGPGNLYPPHQGMMSGPNGMGAPKYPPPGGMPPNQGKVPVVHQQSPPGPPSGRMPMNQHPAGPPNGKQSANYKQPPNRGPGANAGGMGAQGPQGYRPGSGHPPMNGIPGPMPPSRPHTQQGPPGPYPPGPNYPPGPRPGMHPNAPGMFPGPTPVYGAPPASQGRKPPGPGYPGVPPGVPHGHPGSHPPHANPPNMMHGGPQPPRGNIPPNQMMQNGGRPQPQGYKEGQQGRSFQQGGYQGNQASGQPSGGAQASSKPGRPQQQPDANWVIQNREQFEKWDPHQQEHMLTQLLYPLVLNLGLNPELANNVTAILVDSEIYKLEEILDLFKNPQELAARVDEAVKLVDTNNK